jgi:hypothetical protein
LRKCFKNASKCFKILQNASKCFKMLQKCSKMLPNHPQLPSQNKNSQNTHNPSRKPPQPPPTKKGCKKTIKKWNDVPFRHPPRKEENCAGDNAICVQNKNNKESVLIKDIIIISFLNGIAWVVFFVQFRG